MAVNAPAPKGPKSLLLRTHWPELVIGPHEPQGDQEEQSIVILGAYLKLVPLQPWLMSSAQQPPHISHTPQGCCPHHCWTLVGLRTMVPTPGCWGHTGQPALPEGCGADL